MSVTSRSRKFVEKTAFSINYVIWFVFINYYVELYVPILILE